MLTGRVTHIEIIFRIQCQISQLAFAGYRLFFELIKFD